MKTKNGYQIILCESFSAAEAYRGDWDRWSADFPFLSWTWMFNWWQAIGHQTGREQNRLAIAVVINSNDQVVGIAPFYVKLGWSGRSLQILGDGKASTDYLRILTTAEHQAEVARSLAEWIVSEQFRRMFGQIDLIQVEGYRSDQDDLNILWHELERFGWKLNVSPIENSWVLSLKGTLESVHRRAIESQRRKVKKLYPLIDIGEISVEVVEQVEQFEQDWSDFVRLHQLRRMEVGQEGCFACPKFESFLKKATYQLIALKQAKLVYIKKEEIRFAVTLLLVNNSSAFVYQTGSDSRFKEFDPGHLCNAYLIRWAHEAGMQEYDFLRGDEHYKKRWGAEPIPLYRARFVSPNWSARVKENLWQTARSVKRQSETLMKWIRRPSNQQKTPART